MKTISYRMWLLMLGIAVALVITMAALVSHNRAPSAFSPMPGSQKATPSVVLKKVLEKAMVILTLK